MNDLLKEALLECKDPLFQKELKEIHCISSSTINHTWKLELSNGQKLFAKTVDKKESLRLKFEAIGLKCLAQFADSKLLNIPKPLTISNFKNHSALLLSWIDKSHGDQTNLGKGLALLHQSSAKQSPEKFGWDMNGFIGDGPQPAGWEKSWGKCFVKLRLIPQIKLASKWGLNIHDWEELMNSLTEVLNDHKPLPSLVHGDLWSGNIAIESNGKGVIFDPATWWADREVDLAMTKLFGGFSKEFYSGYESIWPLPTSSEKRIKIYNLYHILNHANIFGGIYKSQCLSILKGLK